MKNDNSDSFNRHDSMVEDAGGLTPNLQTNSASYPHQVPRRGSGSDLVLGDSVSVINGENRDLEESRNNSMLEGAESTDNSLINKNENNNNNQQNNDLERATALSDNENPTEREAFEPEIIMPPLGFVPGASGNLMMERCNSKE